MSCALFFVPLGRSGARANVILPIQAPLPITGKYSMQIEMTTFDVSDRQREL